MDRKLKVLFVDDDDDILMVVRHAVKLNPSLEVHLVNSGEAAIKESVDFLPDIIFLDVMMPKMDGMATLRAIRLIDEIKKTPVVFFTAKVSKEEISTYLEAGVVDVIMKPFDPLKLGSTIEEIFKKCQSSSA